MPIQTAQITAKYSKKQQLIENRKITKTEI